MPQFHTRTHRNTLTHLGPLIYTYSLRSLAVRMGQGAIFLVILCVNFHYNNNNNRHIESNETITKQLCLFSPWYNLYALSFVPGLLMLCFSLDLSVSVDLSLFLDSFLSLDLFFFFSWLLPFSLTPSTFSRRSAIDKQRNFVCLSADCSMFGL